MRTNEQFLAHFARQVLRLDAIAVGTESAGDRYRATDSPADESSAIRAALAAASGSRARAAELLGMGRTTLWRKMKQYNIELLDGLS